MSVAIARYPAALDGPFDDGDDVFPDDIDWGSATPINTIAELEFDAGLTLIEPKRKTKRVAFPTILENDLPRYQRALFLHALRQPFAINRNHLVPGISRDEEVIVKIKAVGLNPIDWKSADYGYSIPVLPYISGRDFAGVIVKTSSNPTSKHLNLGDVILCPSTDYRDLRKAAFQEYSLATSFTVCRLPKHVSISQGAALGVAYVAAALAMGVCLGVRLPNAAFAEGPDLLDIVRNMPLGRLPRDTVPECLIEDNERPQPGDWIVIWGGSSTSALFLSQLARLAGLKVILVMDTAKHGGSLHDVEGCTYIDSHNSERAVDMIRGITGGNVRFGIDTVGKDTATHLSRCLADTQGASARKGQSHLVALAAMPKDTLKGVSYHSVPVKLFHEVSEIGRALMTWLEQALEANTLELPRVEEVAGGLEGINGALNRMRTGRVSGKRLVVPL